MLISEGKRFELDICGSMQDLNLKNLNSRRDLTNDEKELCRDYLTKKAENPDYNIVRGKSEKEKKETKEKFFNIIEKLQTWSPENPPQNLKVINAIMERLKMEAEKRSADDKEQKVLYFSSISSSFEPIDGIGVDCYFKVGDEIRIKIDVKSYAKDSYEKVKEDEIKATDASFILYQPITSSKSFKDDEEKMKFIENEMIFEGSSLASEALLGEIEGLREARRVIQEKPVKLSEDELRRQRISRMSSGSGKITKFR